jgi:hypothetical protein
VGLACDVSATTGAVSEHCECRHGRNPLTKTAERQAIRVVIMAKDIGSANVDMFLLLVWTIYTTCIRRSDQPQEMIILWIKTSDIIRGIY